MTRYLRLAEVLKLHDLIVAETGGSHGLRDRGLLKSAIAQPQQTFGGKELYPSLVAKQQHWASRSSNKRVRHAAVEAMLVLNGLSCRPTRGRRQ